MLIIGKELLMVIAGKERGLVNPHAESAELILIFLYMRRRNVDTLSTTNPIENIAVLDVVAARFCFCSLSRRGGFQHGSRTYLEQNKQMLQIKVIKLNQTPKQKTSVQKTTCPSNKNATN